MPISLAQLPTSKGLESAFFVVFLFVSRWLSDNWGGVITWYTESYRYFYKGQYRFFSEKYFFRHNIIYFYGRKDKEFFEWASVIFSDELRNLFVNPPFYPPALQKPTLSQWRKRR